MLVRLRHDSLDRYTVGAADTELSLEESMGRTAMDLTHQKKLKAALHADKSARKLENLAATDEGRACVSV
jgi:hypothetical protein